MLGLIKKDLLIIKSSMRIMFIIMIIYLIMGFSSNDSYVFAIIPAIFFLMMTSTFSYDEFNKTDAYITTFPCGKKNVVKAKYLTTIVLLVLSTALSILMTSIVGILKNNLDFQYCLETTIGILLAISFLASIYFPLVYKLGAEKSRIFVFLIVFGLVGLATLLSKLNINVELFNNILTILDDYWFIILPVFIIMIIYISYRASVHIYMKKEF